MSAPVAPARTGQVVGIDIGGSKTHAVSLRHGHEAMAGSSNLASVGTAEAGRQLDSIFDQLIRATDGQPITTVCAGAAGVDTVEAELRLRDLIAAKVPGAAVRVVHDTELILAAAGLDHGIALIAGTGSVAWGRTPSGAVARAGGWGYLLGDEGSGYGIAREAVRHALRLVDRGHRPDRLSQQLAADCGLQRPAQLVDHFYATPERRYWAGHARLVFELAADGDPAASAIVDAAAGELAELVGSVARVLSDADLPVVLGGGVLVHQPILTAGVSERLATIGLTDVRVLDRDPAHGAARLAAAL
ncbi:N-acetylglucosamine kinase [Microlunatus ginsengisoli]|uniref:BadF/BadG/BcrA/BcrD ATPase family protein n=1 Tax=Microlunatus ginsengisoli TaxID=363863 RepID=A0ABP6ZET8_9ACTN